MVHYNSRDLDGNGYSNQFIKILLSVVESAQKVDPEQLTDEEIFDWLEI